MRRRQGVDPNPKLGGCSQDDVNEADSQIPRQGLNLTAANFNAIHITLPERDTRDRLQWISGLDEQQ